MNVPGPLTAEEEDEINTLQQYIIATQTLLSEPAGGRSGGYGDVPLYALPDQQYLERAIMPLLLRGLEEVAVARPPDALAFLGAYLLSNNPQRRAAAGAGGEEAAAAGAEAAAAPGETAVSPIAAAAEATPADGKEAASKGLFAGVTDRTMIAALAGQQFEIPQR